MDVSITLYFLGDYSCLPELAENLYVNKVDFPGKRHVFRFPNFPFSSGVGESLILVKYVPGSEEASQASLRVGVKGGKGRAVASYVVGSLVMWVVLYELYRSFFSLSFTFSSVPPFHLLCSCSLFLLLFCVGVLHNFEISVVHYFTVWPEAL